VDRGQSAAFTVLRPLSSVLDSHGGTAMRYWVALVLTVGWVTPAPAQEPDKSAAENPVHQELRAMRQGVVDAVNKNDVDRLLTYLDKDVVVTWMNAEVSKGPEGVRAYFDKMMKGPN